MAVKRPSDAGVPLAAARHLAALNRHWRATTPLAKR